MISEDKVNIGSPSRFVTRAKYSRESDDATKKSSATALHLRLKYKYKDPRGYICRFLNLNFVLLFFFFIFFIDQSVDLGEALKLCSHRQSLRESPN